MAPQSRSRYFTALRLAKPRFRRIMPMLLTGTVFSFATSARASFHFMQIEQIVAGVDGNADVQAIQLRMRENAQERVSLARLIAWDATGQNPVVLIDFTSDVSGNSAGDRVLVASSAFIKYSNPPVEADFVLTTLIPPEYLSAGSLTFENDDGTLIVWRLSWGGSNYTGPTTGALTNDDDGDFGPPWPQPLPTGEIASLVFTGEASDKSASNATDYVPAEDQVTLANNAGMTFTVTSFSCPDDADHDVDGDAVCSDEDNCPDVANADQTDADGDGVGDACDDCPDDPDKVEPGLCGCRSSDADADGDGVVDCLDNCAEFTNADQTDADGDGFGDACDDCPDDPDKVEPGLCGCGSPDADADGDGVAHCLDNCPGAANADQTDADGDGFGDACDGCPENPDKVEPTSGTCQGSSPPDDDEGSENDDDENENSPGGGNGNSDDAPSNDNTSIDDSSNDDSSTPPTRGGGICGLGMITFLPMLLAGWVGLRRISRGRLAGRT